MKYFYLLLFSLVAAPAMAQISLDTADMARPGQQVLMYTAPVVPPTAGDSGANLSWNFAAAGAPLDPQRDTIAFLPISAAPGNYPISPGENMVIKQGPGLQVVQRRTTGNAQGIFFSTITDDSGLNPANPNQTLVFRLSNPISLVRVPANFSSAWIETGAGQFTFPFDTTLVVSGQTINVDSVRLKLNIRQLSRINGWGNLTTPLETVPALRQAIDQTMTLSIEVFTLLQLLPGFPPVPTWVPVPVPVPPFNTYSVNYWTKGRRFPVASFQLDDTRMVSGVQFQDTVGKTVSSLRPVAGSSFQFYPNPVKQGQAPNMVLPAGVNGFTSISIVQANGQQIYSGALGLAPWRLLPRGTYMLQPTSPAGSNLQPQRLVVE